MNTQSYEWTYKHLVCEFDHWDFCINGLILYEKHYYVCELANPRTCYDEDPKYYIYPIDWNDKCTEYLEDYKIAYAHWFHTNGVRETKYEGWDLCWFEEKWKHKNPIAEQIIQ